MTTITCNVQKENKLQQIFFRLLVYPARALRALGLLLADGAPTVGGGRLFEGSTKFFYGNSCNSGTESRKIVPKVGN